ncbi:ATP-grasp domain-containing protein [Micrococcus luteus]|uniref:ATP-binding protein n=1 Tax=Micrococcus luteus TaxID=1270 RepID=UPI00301B08F6|nr:ATP-grasp domain-containing protein [Micrococcus luteus]
MDLDARPLAGKKLLLLDGSRKSIEIVDEAHRLGVHVIVTDYNTPEQSPAKLAADQHFEVSTSDVDAVVELIRREGVDGVLAGFSDRWLATYAEICAAAQVPCYATVDQIRLFTDKRRYKAMLEQFGVPTITGYSVEDATSGAIPEEAFPLIVKPADGSGSRGISVVASQSELQSGLDVALDYSWTQDLVIERFLPGQEATVYWVFQDGDCRVSLMWHRHMHDFGPQDRYRLPVAYSSPSSLLPTYLADVAPSVQAMMRSAGVRNGIMFMQGLIHEGVFHTYDIGYRVTPTQEYRVVEELCGYNPLSMLIHFALTGTMGEPDLAALAEPRHHGYGFNISTLIRPGTVGSVMGLDDVAALPGVLSTVAAIDAGETLPEEGWGQLRQVAVRTVGVADSLDSLRQTMRRVDELIDVRDEDGASMVIHPDMPPRDLDACVL